MNHLSNVLQKAKGGVSKVGKLLDKKFVEPSRNVNRIHNAKMKVMERAAKSGEFNK